MVTENKNNGRSMTKDVTLIGAAVIDVLAGPVSEGILKTNSMPADMIKLSFGGDALNEAVVLSRLGKRTQLVTKLGRDESGARILNFLEENGISSEAVRFEEGLETSANIVLIDEAGERHFLTKPGSSLRRLEEADIEPYIENAADIVGFASIFVSPRLDVPAMEHIFRRIKQRPGRILAADMTAAKHGETLEDLKSLLPYVDYLLPNETEIALLTGNNDPMTNAERLIDAGVRCAVIKLGKRGCLIRTGDECFEIPAYPVERAVDTTGAGDCFAAGFLWALSEKWPLPDCGRFACALASCSVEHTGATDGVCSLDEPIKRYKRLCSEKR